jgi:phage shock protein A
MAKGFVQQLEDHRTEAETLKSALRKLEQKLEETRSRCEMLIAQHRRARVVSKAQQARQAVERKEGAASMARMRTRIVSREAENAATVEILGGDSLEDRFAMLEREEQIEALLENLKQDLKKDTKQLEAPSA